MYRFAPRFLDPIQPYMAPPMDGTMFRGGPQKGPLSQQGGGMNASGTMENPQRPGGGGFGIGEGAQAAGLLSKLGGGASPLAGLPKQAGLLGDPLLGLGGTPSLDAFVGAGKGAGEIGSFMGGIAGAGGAGGSPFPAMSGVLGGAGDIGGLLGTAAGGPEALAAGADLGLQSAGQSALGLSNPMTAALAAPGLLNSFLGIDIPDPIGGIVSGIRGLFG